MAGHKIRKVNKNDRIGRLIHKGLTSEFCESYVTVGEDETLLPEYYANYAESIMKFEVRNSDVIVASYPKSGTTWTQEMVWLIANDLDFKAAEVLLHQRFPMLEISALFNCQKYQEIVGVKNNVWFENSIEFVRQQKSPRFIKTHLPLSLLPLEMQNGSKSPKIIYIMRDPKDVCISFYHYGKLLEGWQINLEDFTEAFLANKVVFGSYWKHVLGYWKERNASNVLIIKYEDMKNNLQSVIIKVAEFLGKKLTEEQIKLLRNHLSFAAMKTNTAVNFDYVIDKHRNANLIEEEGTFMRSGRVGKYKEELSADVIEKFDVWIKYNIAYTGFSEYCA